MQTPFHAYYTALKLNSLQNEDRLLPVFSEGNINVYPYQVAAALFAMRNPYQKGVVLCDEAGMGKSHEAMLILSQSWYEGKKIADCNTKPGFAYAMGGNDRRKI